MTMYEIVENSPWPTMVKRSNDDGSTTFIPMDESNADYVAYLESLDGN